MGILFTKMRRDIWYNKGRSFSIVMIVIIASAIYGGLFLSWINISNTYDHLESEVNTHDVRFQFTAINKTELNLDHISGIKAWDYRLMMFSGIKIDNSPDSFTGILYGVEHDRGMRVDDVYLLQGSGIVGSPDNSILLSTKFFESQGLGLGDNITVLSTLSGNYNFSIVAEVFSPEYSYNVNPLSGMPDLEGLPVGWVSLDILQKLYGVKDLVNEVIVRFDENIRDNGDMVDTKISEIKAYLQDLNPQVSFVKYEDEANTEMKSSDVDSLGEIARVFGGVILLIALFAVYDNISKLIATQRNYIGTMRALGGGRRKVTLHYTSIATVLGAVAVLLGIPVGWWMSNAMSEAYVSILGLPFINRELIVSAFYESIAINFSMVVIIGLFASLSAANVEPREAMSSMYITASYKKRSFIEKVLEKLPAFKKPSSKIPLRALFQKKRRTFLTILTYSISLVLMISSLSMISTFTVGIERNFNTYEKYDLQVVFTSPLDPSDVQSTMSGIDGISSLERFIMNEVEIQSEKLSVSTPLFAYEENSNLRKLNLREKSSDGGIIIGSILASDLTVSVGDTVKVFDTVYRIGNLADEMMGDGVYMSIPEAQKLLGYGENVSGFLVKMDGSVSEAELKDKIHESGLPIGLVLSTQDIKDGINVMMEGFLAFVGITVFIGFTIVALFTFNTVVLDAMSREMEFVNLRALGCKKSMILKIILSQSIFVVIFGSLLSFPIGYFVSDQVNQSLLKDLMILETVVDLKIYLLAIISAFIASMVGVIAAYRYVNRIDLVEATRKRVNS